MVRKSSKKLKQSLLEYLSENYFSSIKGAETAVKLGIISVNGKTIKRPGGILVNPEEDEVQVIGKGKLFVGRGGYKLQKALEEFELDVKDKVCLDIGSSTGGFTDCLLQYAARQVYAIDTGYGQLDWGLRKNPRVHCIERTNVRYLLPERLYLGEQPELADFIVVDVSFISVLKLIPSIQRLSAGPDLTEIVVLIKPQFEAGRNNVARGGVVRNPQIHFDILLNFVHSCYRAGLDLKHLTHSPILGNSGNLEFLCYLTWPKGGHRSNPSLEEWLKQVLHIAYNEFSL